LSIPSKELAREDEPDEPRAPESRVDACGLLPASLRPLPWLPFMLFDAEAPWSLRPRLALFERAASLVDALLYLEAVALSL
jgi:hypothetical protein